MRAAARCRYCHRNVEARRMRWKKPVVRWHGVLAVLLAAAGASPAAAPRRGGRDAVKPLKLAVGERFRLVLR